MLGLSFSTVNYNSFYRSVNAFILVWLSVFSLVYTNYFHPIYSNQSLGSNALVTFTPSTYPDHYIKRDVSYILETVRVTVYKHNQVKSTFTNTNLPKQTIQVAHYSQLTVTVTRYATTTTHARKSSAKTVKATRTVKHITSSSWPSRSPKPTKSFKIRYSTARVTTTTTTTQTQHATLASIPILSHPVPSTLSMPASLNPESNTLHKLSSGGVPTTVAHSTIITSQVKQVNTADAIPITTPPVQPLTHPREIISSLIRGTFTMPNAIASDRDVLPPHASISFSNIKLPGIVSPASVAPGILFSPIHYRTSLYPHSYPLLGASPSLHPNSPSTYYPNAPYPHPSVSESIYPADRSLSISDAMDTISPMSDSSHLTDSESSLVAIPSIDSSASDLALSTTFAKRFFVIIITSFILIFLL